MKYRENISKNIKYFRNLSAMTQEELANLIGGKKSLISNYENGYSLPDILVLIMLADIFEISLDDLVGRNFF